MVLGRAGGGCQHGQFRDLPRWLRPRSLLVLNDTRVIAARLVGSKPTGGRVEVLLVRRWLDQPSAGPHATGGAFSEDWQVLARGLAALAPGARLDFGPALDAELVSRGDRGQAVVRFHGRRGADLVSLAEEIGAVPLPPYVEAARRRRGEPGAAPEAASTADRERYQTVYARAPGAVAAPTAGLHFTDQLLAAVLAAGHEVARVTLHVGPGTFRPVEVEDPRGHRLEAEPYAIDAAAAAAINRAAADGRPIVAVGTTVVRTLEAAARRGLPLEPGAASTDLCLLPGDAFRLVTDLVTNFHLPRSTLLMLVAAFAGHGRVLEAYGAAVAAGYRFYSYGDAMFIRAGELPAPGEQRP